MMTDDELGSLVCKRRDSSMQFIGNVQTRDRKEALQFYRGDNLELYGDSGDGRSTVVARDTMESIESILPPLLKPFVSGDEVVRFEPRGPEDEDAAKQATEYINYLFNNHNNSFRVIYDLAKDGLLFRLGVAKVTYEEIDEVTTERYEGLDTFGIEALRLEPNVEIEGKPEGDDQNGYNVIVKVTEKRKNYRVCVVAPDEFLIEARLVSLDMASFVAHKARRTVGDLIAMGLPKAKCMALQSGVSETDERTDRFNIDEKDESLAADDLARMVEIFECYVRCDYSGKGILSWRKVIIAGENDAVLSNEEVDCHPFVAWTPIPIPHKLIGQSIHDLTRDIQIQKTALSREMLDNLYLVNRPMRTAVEGQVNMEEALDPQVGGVIRVKQQGALQNLETPFVAAASFNMIEYLDTQREQRTGSTRYNQGLDANSLNKTATGVTAIMGAAQQRLELIARQFAECALKGIFQKMLELVCKHGDQEEVVRLRGEWVPMDPREWKNNYDMSVAVGIGTGNRDQMVGQLTNLLNLDERIIQLQGGIDGPILTAENVYEKLKRMVEAMGLKGIERYYSDPGKVGQERAPEAPSPSPIEQAQMQADIEIQKAQIKAGTDIKIAEIQERAKMMIAAGGALLDMEQGQEFVEEPIMEGLQYGY